MEDGDIAALISYKPDAFVKKIVDNLSKNRRLFIIDEKETHPVPVRICREVTDKFLSDLRKSWEQGDLLLLGKDGKEIWIT